MPQNGYSADQPLQAALLQGRRLPSLKRLELIKTAAMKCISEQQFQGRRIRCGRKSQKGGAVVRPDQPPEPAAMPGQAIRGCRRTQSLLPDLRHRCGGISLKTLNEASPPTELKQLCCSTAIKRRRQQAGRAEPQGGQKKSTTQEERLCTDDIELRV